MTELKRPIIIDLITKYNLCNRVDINSASITAFFPALRSDFVEALSMFCKSFFARCGSVKWRILFISSDPAKSLKLVFSIWSIIDWAISAISESEPRLIESSNRMSPYVISNRETTTTRWRNRCYHISSIQVGGLRTTIHFRLSNPYFSNRGSTKLVAKSSLTSPITIVSPDL